MCCVRTPLTLYTTPLRFPVSAPANYYSIQYFYFEGAESNEYGQVCAPEDAPEAITKAVASLPPEQMFELMKQMKLYIQHQPEDARQLLLHNPQLAYALLQAQVVMRVVDPHQAHEMLHEPRPPPPILGQVQGSPHLNEEFNASKQFNPEAMDTMGAVGGPHQLHHPPSSSVDPAGMHHNPTGGPFQRPPSQHPSFHSQPPHDPRHYPESPTDPRFHQQHRVGSVPPIHDPRQRPQDPRVAPDPRGIPNREQIPPPQNQISMQGQMPG